jgi:predicted lipoprotein with Yx(FWY)xxD motif
VTVPAVLLASGCGGSAPPAGALSGGPRVAVLAKSVRGLGTVIVSSGGYVLYVFAPDNRRLVTCTGLCAATWPPVRLPASATLAAGPGVKASLLGSDPDPAGGRRVLTYGGWPLYGYTGDVTPGQYTGQGIDLNGGAWYAIRPSGQPIKMELP